MKKVLFVLLTFLTLICNGDDELRARFVYTYYSGDFVKAHDQLDAAFSDPVLHSIWEERIHHHGEIANCKHESSAGALGFAILKTGDVESAAKVFQDDWLSLLGKATSSTWQNDLYKARELVLESVKLAPDRPEPYYFAGNLSHTTDESTGYFLQFLKLIKEDPYRKQSVQNAVEFMNRTRGMELNIPTKLEDFEELESKIEDDRLVVKVNIDGEKKIPLMVAIKIDPQAVTPDDVEMLQDLIVAAYNEAFRKAEDEASEKMGAMTGNLKIPGLGNMF